MMDRRHLLAILIAFGVTLYVLVWTSPGREVPLGKKRVSQPALLVQSLGATQVRVRYNRPSARGRVLFGGIVPWDSVWCPGADEATTIETTSDLYVGRALLREGKYSVWAIPRSAAPWTLIFSSKAKTYHVPYPGAGRDALRIEVQPARGAFVESLQYDFPVATPDSAVLEMRWGAVAIPISLRPR